jgi:hypothetical protein
MSRRAGAFPHPPPRSGDPDREVLTTRTRTRLLFVSLSASLVLLVAAGCSGGQAAAPASGAADAAQAPAAEGAASRGLPASVELPPAAERPTWFDVATPQVTVDAKPEEIERAEIETRRRASLPDGPQFDSRARSQEPEPVKWMDLAVDITARRNMNPMRISRNNAVLAVAMHDAVVAAARAGVIDERPGPDGEAPSSLPAEVVAAGAAWKVGTTLYPAEKSRFDVLAAAQRRRAAALGTKWPATYDAAWAFGVAVGEQVATQAATDGSVAAQPEEWQRPAGASWEPTPGLFSPPLEPAAARWKPWNIGAASDFRAPPPPQPGSKDFDDALAQVKRNVAQLSDPQNRIAKFWDMGPGTSTPAGYWMQEAVAPLAENSPPDDQATILAVAATAIADAGIVSWDAKYTYGLGRPVTYIRASGDPADAEWLPALPTPSHPAYTSGHSTITAAAAVALGGLFPTLADRLAAGAAEAGDSRVLAGIHYWFDNSAGLENGGRIGRAALQRFGLEADPELPRSKAVLVSPDAKPRDAEVGSAGIRLDG